MFPSISTSSTLNTMSVWTISFLVVTLVEGLIITAFERYPSPYCLEKTEIAHAFVVMSLPNMPLAFLKTSSPNPQTGLFHSSLILTLHRTIPTYLALFIFAFLFDIALSYDAIRLQNTIQVPAIPSRGWNMDD